MHERFGRVLVANRGEIALRVIRACRDLGIETVIAFSEADRDSLPVRTADSAVCIGPGPAGKSYLSIPRVLTVASGARCDAVHPGYGFLAENARFAAECERHGIVFVGPRSETIALLGDKIAARRTAVEAGVPVIPGSHSNVEDAGAARALGDHLGYPLLVKSSGGGGGKGLRRVDAPSDL
ncbi:MAG: biotin carboxylase N-terminal domain-containing protein, partial [Actinomycetota bacterium]